ncbi:unnamed protein product [Mytilus edulis]|uniref:Uncharacterized protein n=1 Tax=Mytilus edulis TaxID=6550 RepID=A0A8S3RVP6_MYTED|nr:unnamed protein product [Mytilus edulis]
MLSQARKQVVNLSHRKLTDDEYLVLSRGLKFIPSPSVKRAKQDLLHDFDELARKMRCRYLYHGNLDEIHHFRVKSGHTPPLTCNTLENYLFNTKHELSSMQIRKFRNNLSLSQRSGISSLLNDESLIIKKADKSNNVVILDKVNYLLEGDRQLNTQHYTKLENFDLKALRCNINTYVKGMYTKCVIDYSTFNYLNNGNQIDYGPGFSAISDLDIEENDINNTWEQTKNVILETCEETLGYMQYKRKNWMSDNTWVKVEERRKAKEKVLNAITRQQKRQTQDLYREKDKEVKKNCKQDKRDYVEQLAQEAEIACSKGDIKSLYNTTKQLSGRRSNSSATVKDKNGNVKIPPSYNRKPPSYNRKPPSYNRKPPSYNRKPPSYNRKPPSYNRKPPSYNRKAPSYNRKAPSYNRKPPSYNRKPPSYNRKPPSYNRKPPSYNRKPPSYNRKPPSFNRKSTFV